MNAFDYVKSLTSNYPIAELISRGTSKKKSLTKRQQEIVCDMISATNAKIGADKKMKGYDQTLLAMHVTTFVNTIC